MTENWEKVAAVDLKSVRLKFLFKKGRWWRMCKSAERIEREYRQFLYLIVCNPGQTIVPWSRDLDDFWHEHILDTAKYAQDCQNILGSFIHHNPHLPEGSAPHIKAFAATRQMYKSAFKKSAREGRKRGRSDVGCGTDMQVVFCDSSASSGHHGDGHHHDAGGHHGGGHGGGGHHGGGGDHGGHGCGGHGGGHGCGGHGCGGHGCGGHGCGGGGH
jgi:hypothetical protein